MTDPMEKGINFLADKDKWVMKIKPEGIFFNREAYPDSNADEFANAVIQILEKSFAVTFERKTPPYVK